MGLVRGLSTTRTKRRKSKKTKQQRQAELQHEKWLKKNGVHKSQLKQQPRKRYKPKKSYRREQNLPTSDKVEDIKYNQTWKDKEEQKKVSEQYVIQPAYNKGNYQVIGKKELHDMGKKK